MMISTVKGNCGSCEITAVGSDKTPESAKVIVTIDPSSINTRDNDRDNHLKSPDFFDVEKHKEIKFESTSISKKGEPGERIYLHNTCSSSNWWKSYRIDFTFNSFRVALA